MMKQGEYNRRGQEQIFCPVLILREQEKNFSVHTFFCFRRVKTGQNRAKQGKNLFLSPSVVFPCDEISDFFLKIDFSCSKNIFSFNFFLI
jgi:hypothetical protein